MKKKREPARSIEIDAAGRTTPLVERRRPEGGSFSDAITPLSIDPLLSAHRRVMALFDHRSWKTGPRPI